jgi:gas vesicle protein
MTQKQRFFAGIAFGLIVAAAAAMTLAALR